MRCEERTLDDIRAMGGNSPEDERRFATAARVSEINLSLYRAFAQPMVNAIFTPQLANWLKQWSPDRLQYVMFSDSNPLMKSIARAAEQIREHRKPASANNPFLALQERISERIISMLDDWRDRTEKLSEQVFLAIYGSPALQAAVGIDPNEERPRKPGKSLLHRELLQARIADLKSLIDKGGLRECVIRGLLYVGMARGKVDERGARALRQFRLNEGAQRLMVSEFKAMARDQFLLLLLEPEATLAAIPKMLPTSVDERQKGLAAIREVLSASGAIFGEAAQRMKQVVTLFETSEATLPVRGTEMAKAS
jgi:hypothetical protein